jgi:hypothetical protein
MKLGDQKMKLKGKNTNLLATYDRVFKEVKMYH